ncbi:hypothetical protein [Gordonia sp. (in: high G+C Gram-positive bacteria)]|uniref:hypothetical protein n=1 Tax=Gordonia sp. (in: high G+C Gram-positive bacteria) TaxID=84139 RepID=UPI003F9A892F
MIAFAAAVFAFLAAGCGEDSAQESAAAVRKVCVAPGEGLLPSGVERTDQGLVKPDRNCDPEHANASAELWEWPTSVRLPEVGAAVTNPTSSEPLMVVGPPTSTR